MHSILESDGVSSDPFEVLCHMGTLIIEGRIPKAVGDSTAPSEAGAKSAKPYNEGPHCPIFMKLYNKDPHNIHKCTENNMLCIRYNNLKQNLEILQQKSVTICIEVSLGPDCLCGELRSQSTLVSTQPSKRDIVLEQWTITLGHKLMQEPSSQMSVLNLYQAVRSLLHFSQLTAWYMSHQGMKPAHVIYRVGTPEDSTFISDDNFVNHDFPVADVNKTVSMKISLKTLPRMEKIPIVFCPQHSNTVVDGAPSSHFEGRDTQKFNKEKSYLGAEQLHSKFNNENKEELLENKLPLKFQGVRKKTNEAQERKRKKHITLYESPSPLGMDSCSGVEFFDGIPIDVKKLSPDREAEYYGSKRMFQGESLKLCQGESSKAEYKKSKAAVFPSDLSDLVKPQSDFKTFDTFSCNYFEQKMVDPTIDLMIGLKSFSDSKNKSDFRTKGKVKSSCGSAESSSEPTKKKIETKSVMDILDDRMQISCAISGKHHCKWECEEESDLNKPGDNVEKPKRRRSLSKARNNDAYEDLKLGSSDSEKILHGKFKDVDCCKSDLCSPFRELEMEKIEENQSSPLKTFSKCSQSSDTVYLESPTNSKTITNFDVNESLLEETNNFETPKIESLPFLNKCGGPSCDEAEETAVEPQEEWSSPKQTSPDRKEKSSWVRKESFESFRRGCAFAREAAAEYSSDSEAELSESSSEASNPFLAAILRTTRRSKTPKDLKKGKKCDSSIKNNLSFDGKESPQRKSGLLLEKFKDSIKRFTSEQISDLHAKVNVGEKEEPENSAEEENHCELFQKAEKYSDLRSNRNKYFPVKNWNSEEVAVSKFSAKALDRTANVLGNEDLKEEEDWDYEEYLDDISSNNLNGTKTIPVPSAQEKMKFRRSLDSAAQLVFHRCSGLPLTSSPAPVRRNNSSFSFDSTLNSVSAIKSALFEPSNSLSSEDENESEGSLKSPASPGAWSVGSKLINYHSLSPLPLLGSFEESVLNGRLEPVSTVQGFTAELGASGSFCPRHLHLPVTVFFYTLGDNDKVSAPYLGHINLGKKGYNVPRSGTIQVTLFNPMRTVVKMFVVVYDLHDMPVNSHTFLRQRTLYVPANQKESTYTDKKKTPFEQEDYHKYLRYLIHLRFVSGKTGRIYLHTDIRMVIFRKADEDTATALGNQSDGESYELRSHTHGPINPKFSPRK